jgi:hypothetical protein
MADLSAYVRSSLAVSPADQYYREPHIGGGPSPSQGSWTSPQVEHIGCISHRREASDRGARSSVNEVRVYRPQPSAANRNQALETVRQ